MLSGGEIAAMALIDACVRLLPGVMGKLASGADESFSDGLLEYPQYTRPQEFEGRPIPEILHIRATMPGCAAWRRAEAEALTKARRPGSLIGTQDRRPKTAQKARRKGDKPQPLPYTSAKSAQWQDRWTLAQPAPGAGRAADGDFAMNLIQELEKEQFDKLSAGKAIPEFGPGDTVIVNVKVVEGDALARAGL